MLHIGNMSVLKNEIKAAIDRDRSSSFKREMRKGADYYEGKHDIRDYKLYYFDGNGTLQEEKYRSNTRIPHQFFTELVDQKVQYLLSNPVVVETEQEGLQELLDQYINEDFQLMLQDLVEGASQKSTEFVFFNEGVDGVLFFKAADAKKIIPFYDQFLNIKQVLYYYDEQVEIKGQSKQVTKVQFWTEEEVYYFVYFENIVELDGSLEINPMPHIIKKDDNGNVYGKGLGRVPFLQLDNNRQKTTDLKPIKDLIDDYDMMACALSNNLIDFDHPIYAVRGYQGDNLNELVTNLKTKKTVGIDGDGGIEVITTDIPIEARKAKLAIDKEAIYKFGMGFDSSQSGDGNITNVVIKSRYTLLDLKCNKIETRLRAILMDMLKLIVENINKLHRTNYDTSDIEIVIARNVPTNESDNAAIAKTEADTQAVLITNILNAAPRLDDETVLKLLAGVLEVDVDEVKDKLEEQSYQAGFNQATEVDDDGIEQVPEGNREPVDEVGSEDGDGTL